MVEYENLSKEDKEEMNYIMNEWHMAGTKTLLKQIHPDMEHVSLLKENNRLLERLIDMQDGLNTMVAVFAFILSFFAFGYVCIKAILPLLYFTL